jgi:hypothetical protein
MKYPKNYEESALSSNCQAYDENEKGVDKDKISFCVIVPFSTEDNALIYCKEDVEKWIYDEIIISKEDYEELLKKSNKLRILLKLKYKKNE